MISKMMLTFFVVFLAAPLSVLAEPAGQDGFWNEQKTKIKTHREQQRRETREFRKGLKDLPPEQKLSNMINYRNIQFGGNLAFREQIHRERIAHLQERLNANGNLTAEQRQKILSEAENEYLQAVERAKQRHLENMNTMEQIGNDPNLTQEQKRERIKTYWQARREENRSDRQERREKRRLRRQG